MLYFDYLKERLDRESIVTDRGFLVYSTHSHPCRNNSICLEVHDFYIKPSYRGDRKTANDFVKEAAKIAKKEGCEYAISQIDIFTTGYQASLIYQLKWGMKIVGTNNNLIYLEMKIEDLKIKE
jgi:hypothetical protein